VNLDLGPVLRPAFIFQQKMSALVPVGDSSFGRVYQPGQVSSVNKVVLAKCILDFDADHAVTHDILNSGVNDNIKMYHRDKGKVTHR
jgi:hypothetical protein